MNGLSFIGIWISAQIETARLMGQRMHCSPSDRKSKEANNDNTYNGMTYSQWINNPHDNPKVINLTGHGKQGRQET